MRRFWSVIGLFIILLIGALIFSLVHESNRVWRTAKVEIRGVTFNVEIADSLLQQTQGLADRVGLSPNSGMLFVFDGPAIRKFWMKDMKFPIDIIWIANDKVVDIVANAQPEGGPEFTIYTSPQPVDKVLEINAGTAANIGIQVGDLIKISNL